MLQGKPRRSIQRVDRVRLRFLTITINGISLLNTPLGLIITLELMLILTSTTYLSYYTSFQ